MVPPSPPRRPLKLVLLQPCRGRIGRHGGLAAWACALGHPAWGSGSAASSVPGHPRAQPLGRRSRRRSSPRTFNEVRDRLARAGSGTFELGPAPAVLLFVGVNGSGKTTTIAKLAGRLQREGRSIALAAADTFRAAAIEQLRIWGEQLGLPVIAQRAGADPGAVAFDAVAAAESRGLDVVLIDTAGRLQNKSQLMAELGKIRRVVERRLPGQPRHVLLVLDATTGQNGLAQAESFSREARVTGIILTKLDGTAKGGIAVAIADSLRLPIVFVGVGEGIEDLAPFDLDAYVEWLLAA
ncbi:MAG: signal recognition particle-docking protein FtsY [Chloroflexi bacterium]|nr:MAG: signal recognition particle-docking protein FtsY [Chloroflexota bacterium]